MDEASIGRLAYQLWENAGRPAGRDLEFWLAAEAEVRASAPATASTNAKVSAALPPKEKALKAPRVSRGGIKKTWPKPYPSLPRF